MAEDDQMNLWTETRAPENYKAGVLIRRIKDGHIKIWDRWYLILPMQEGSGKDKYLDNWDNAVVRLCGLVKELVAHGRRECIYKKGSLQDPCLACPVPAGSWEKERCPAWSLEI